jgi:hypothetical protein
MLILLAGSGRAGTVTVHAFDAALESVYGAELPPDYRPALVQLIAGAALSSSAQTSVIGEPRIRFIFLTRCAPGGLLRKLAFVRALCTFSRRNAIACHRAGADLFAVENVVGPESDACLALFSAITPFAASGRVVQTFFALLKADRSSARQPLLRALSAVAVRCARQPRASFPLLAGGPRAIVNGVTAPPSSFTFACWLAWEQMVSGYVLHIFTVSDNRGQLLSVVGRAGAFVAEWKTPFLVHKTVASPTATPNGWSLLTVSVSVRRNRDKDGDGSAVEFAIEGRPFGTATFPAVSFSVAL